MSVLNGLTVTDAQVDDGNTLRLSFPDEAMLVIDGEESPETSVEAWWIAQQL